MTSIARKMIRAAKRRTGTKPDKDRPWTTDIRDDHYVVLHPTRGWRRISNRRVEAQRRMAHLLGA